MDAKSQIIFDLAMERLICNTRYAYRHLDKIKAEYHESSGLGQIFLRYRFRFLVSILEKLHGTN